METQAEQEYDEEDENEDDKSQGPKEASTFTSEQLQQDHKLI